jgi:hypothetical protein
VKKAVPIFLLVCIQLVLNAQPLPVYYTESSHTDIRRQDFSQYLKNNSPFSLLLAKDTLLIPSHTSLLILGKNGKVMQDLPFDTAAYCTGRDFIIAGQKRKGQRVVGVCDLKGNAIIPIQYKNIVYLQTAFALQNEQQRWALSDLKGNLLTAFVYTDITPTAFDYLKVKSKSGTGILKPNGVLQIDTLYQDILPLAADRCRMQPHSRWQQLDAQKNILHDLVADSIAPLNDSLYLYFFEGRVWIKDSTLSIIGAQEGYTRVAKAGKNFFQVSQGNYSGLLSPSGKEILPIRYYQFEFYEDASFPSIHALGDEIKVLRYSDVVNKKLQRWSVHDLTGRNIFGQKQFKAVRPFTENKIAFQNPEGRWGFGDTSGRIHIAPQYAYVYDFKNGYTLVQPSLSKPNDYQLLNAQKQVLFSGKEAQLFYLGIARYRPCLDSVYHADEPLEELYYGVPPYRYDSFSPAEYGFVRVRKNNYSGLLLADGTELIHAYQDTIYHASPDTFFLYKRADGQIGYADPYGTTLWPTDRFEHVEPLQNGYSRFRRDDLYGFLDPYGNVPIAPKYSNCGHFTEGMAPVWLQGKWGFIDKDENLSVQPYYKNVKPFKNGCALVQNKNNKWLFVDCHGNAVNTTVYDRCEETPSGHYLVLRNGRWGLNTPTGKEIFFPKYESIEVLEDDLYKVKKDGKFGIMDTHENIVLYYQYDNLQYNPYTKTFWVKYEGRPSDIPIPASGK